MQRARSSFGAAATIASAAAAAAERLHDPAELPLKYWAVLAVLALIGWGASSLPLAAGYVSAFLAAYGGDRYLARRADRELERSDPPR